MRPGPAFVATSLLALLAPHVAAAESPHETARTVVMSSALRQLFVSEMRELTGGIQAVAAAVPLGDWAAVARAAEAMRASYVLERQLTAAQRTELAALPEAFKALDEGFHRRAGSLAAAATAGDAELVVYQHARLVETCVACHAQFAAARFPGLGAQEEAHRH